MYELLSTENRQYNKQEQTMFVVNALKKDTRFKDGIEYVLATVLGYQRDSRLNNEITYPMDLEIDEIAVTIDERSVAYTVGSHQDSGIKSNTFTNPYASTPSINVARGGTWSKKPYEKNQDHRYGNQQRGKGRDNSIECKVCMGVGHCATNENTICYILAKTHMCTRFTEREENKQVVRSNTHRYRKQVKEKARKGKMDSRFNNVIKKMVDEGQLQQDIDPIIKLARALNVQSEINDTSDGDSDSDDNSQQSDDS